MATYTQFGRWTAVLAGASVIGVSAWYYRPTDERLTQRDMAELVEASTERSWALCIGTNLATLRTPRYFDPRSMWVYYGVTNTVLAAPLRDVVYGSANKVRRAAWGLWDETRTATTGVAHISFVRGPFDGYPLWDNVAGYRYTGTCDRAVLGGTSAVDFRNLYGNTNSAWWTVGHNAGTNQFFMNWETPSILPVNALNCYHPLTNADAYYTHRSDPSRDVMDSYTNIYEQMKVTWQVGKRLQDAVVRYWPNPPIVAPAWAGRRQWFHGVARADRGELTEQEMVDAAWAAAIAQGSLVDVESNIMVHAWRNVYVHQTAGSADFAVADISYCWIDAVPEYPCWPAVETGMVKKVSWLAEISANVGYNSAFGNTTSSSVTSTTNTMTEANATNCIANSFTAGALEYSGIPIVADSFSFAAIPTNGVLYTVNGPITPTTGPQMAFTFGITNAPDAPVFPGDFSAYGSPVYYTHRSGFQVNVEHCVVAWKFNTFTNQPAVWQ